MALDRCGKQSSPRAVRETALCHGCPQRGPCSAMHLWHTHPFTLLSEPWDCSLLRTPGVKILVFGSFESTAFPRKQRVAYQLLTFPGVSWKVRRDILLEVLQRFFRDLMVSDWFLPFLLRLKVNPSKQEAVRSKNTGAFSCWQIRSLFHTHSKVGAGLRKKPSAPSERWVWHLSSKRHNATIKEAWSSPVSYRSGWTVPGVCSDFSRQERLKRLVQGLPTSLEKSPRPKEIFHWIPLCSHHNDPFFSLTYSVVFYLLFTIHWFTSIHLRNAFWYFLCALKNSLWTRDIHLLFPRSHS